MTLMARLFSVKLNASCTQPLTCLGFKFSPILFGDLIENHCQLQWAYLALNVDSKTGKYATER